MTPLSKEKETELFNYEGKGVITHLWFGGLLDQTVVKIYVDGEETPSIDMEVFLGHGIGFKNETAPWGTARMGNIGKISGIYNSFKIPFGKSIRITAIIQEGGKEKFPLWWIVRGTENLPLEVGGIKLPENARLKLHKLENYEAKPLEEFDLVNVGGNGMLYLVTMEGKGLQYSDKPVKDLSYMESIPRAYIGGSEEPLLLASGLEDYFLGTYYFNTGLYHNEMAGLTHFDKLNKEFSGYRFHEDDPIFYQNGLRLTNRAGEEIDGFVFGFGAKGKGTPPAVKYTVYTWLYQW